MKWIIEIKNLFVFRQLKEDKALREEFYAEIAFLNFNRQRYFGFILALLGLFFLYSDFFLGDFWQTYQVSQFMLLDITVILSATIILLVSYINPPKNPSEIKTWHLAYFYIYLFYHLFWATGISIIEARTANGFPTYLVGVFTAATIYLHRGIPLLIYLVTSLVILYAGLIRAGFTFADMVNQFYAAFILVILAWIMSRVMMNTRIRSFLDKKEIEIARDNLDKRVHERTLELEKTNERLLAEIKERERYEKGLKREKKKAEEADRLKSVFLANISHEIRTPLNGLLGFGDLLRNTSLADDKKEKYLNIMNTNGQQLLKIIDDVMDISMIESNQLKLNLVDFNFGDLLPEAKVFFENYCQNLGKAQLEIVNTGLNKEKAQKIKSDPTRIQQILYNLLSNAVKFTHEGSIQFGVKISQHYALVYVQDTGIGVSPEIANTIFERFRQGEESTKRTYGGNGLGLSISNGLTELLGGLLWIDQSYSKGARFCFSVPIDLAKHGHLTPTLLAQYKKLSANVMAVSDHAEETNQLSFFSGQNKFKIPAISSKELIEVNRAKLPDSLIILFNSQETEQHNFLLTFIEKSAEKNIIAIIDENSKLKSELEKAGCNYILERPINLQEVLFILYNTLNV